jgi:hypothetical protein
MKKFVSLLLSAALALTLSIAALADFQPETDYMERMLSAASAGDTAGGLAAEKSRNEKIDAICPGIQKDFVQRSLPAGKNNIRRGGQRMAAGGVEILRGRGGDEPGGLAGIPGHSGGGADAAGTVLRPGQPVFRLPAPGPAASAHRSAPAGGRAPHDARRGVPGQFPPGQRHISEIYGLRAGQHISLPEFPPRTVRRIKNLRPGTAAKNLSEQAARRGFLLPESTNYYTIIHRLHQSLEPAEQDDWQNV